MVSADLHLRNYVRPDVKGATVMVQLLNIKDCNVLVHAKPFNQILHFTKVYVKLLLANKVKNKDGHCKI